MSDQPTGADADLRNRLLRAEAALGGTVDAESRAALTDLVAGRPVTVRRPARWVPWVDAARRAWSLAGRPPAVPGLPPCLQLTRRPAWPASSIEWPGEAACAAAAACPAKSCAYRAGGRVDGLRPLRHGDSAAAVDATVEAICAAWGQVPSPAVRSWVDAMRAIEPVVGPERFEFSLKRVGDRLSPRLRLVDLDPGAVDNATGAARMARIADGFAERMPGATGRAARQFIDLFETHHGPKAGLSIGIDAPLDGGPARLQLYAHQGFDDQAPNRRHMLAALRWAGASGDALRRMADLAADRSVALVVFAPTADDPRGIKVYVGAPFELSRPALGLPSLSPPDYAPDWSLAVWRCGSDGLAWEKRDFPSTAHPQSSAAVIADVFAGLTPDDRQRARDLLDGRSFLPWLTWISVRPDAKTLYFHAR